MRRSRNEDPASLIAKEADAVLDYALSAEEKEWCQNVVTFGPDWLRQQKSWKAAAIRQFIGRAEVQREINSLKRQYEDRTGIQERTQFFAQIKINGMVPAALNIVARALRGSMTDAAGNVVAPPTKQQLEAATLVLDRSNIQGEKFNGNDQTPSIDARSVTLAIGGTTQDGTDALGAEGREKVRGILNHVLNRSRALADKRDMPAEERRKSLRRKLDIDTEAIKDASDDE